MSKETNARRAGIITVIILAAFAGWLLVGTLTADAAGCATGTIDWTETSPQWAPTHDEQGIRTAIVGTFLWVQYGERGGEYDGTVSVELDGTEALATVCPDGTVTFESAPAPGISTAVTLVNFETLWGFDPTLDLRVAGPR
jgi:hypothetical protein